MFFGEFTKKITRIVVTFEAVEGEYLCFRIMQSLGKGEVNQRSLAIKTLSQIHIMKTIKRSMIKSLRDEKRVIKSNHR